jgi:plasmid stabilization system protein ParE
MSLEVVWTRGAENDLVELHHRLFEALDGDSQALFRVLEKPLSDSISLLSSHPEIAPRVRGLNRVRRRIFGPDSRYGLFYCVEARGIIIHAVLDLRQDPKRIQDRLKGL